MPYDAVKHLRAMDEYLSAQGVKTIKDLPEGVGPPPSDDPQVYLGAIGIWATSDYTYKTLEDALETAEQPRSPVPPSCFSACFARAASGCHICHPPLPPRTMPIANKFFRFLDDGSYELSDAYAELVYSFTRTAVAGYVTFDRILRLGEFSDTVRVPGGYDDWCSLFNADDDCDFGFTTFDHATRNVVLRGRVVPEDELLPPLPEVVAPQAAPQFSAKQLNIVNHLL